MNKLFILLAFSACFMVATASRSDSNGTEGGYEATQYDPSTEKLVYNLAVSTILSVPANAQVNALPRLVGFYTKIVSGTMYKLIIAFGKNTYQIEILSQPWLNNLSVETFTTVNNTA